MAAIEMLPLSGLPHLAQHFQQDLTAVSAPSSGAATPTNRVVTEAARFAFAHREAVVTPRLTQAVEERRRVEASLLARVADQRVREYILRLFRLFLPEDVSPPKDVVSYELDLIDCRDQFSSIAELDSAAERDVEDVIETIRHILPSQRRTFLQLINYLRYDVNDLTVLARCIRLFGLFSERAMDIESLLGCRDLCLEVEKEVLEDIIALFDLLPAYEREAESLQWCISLLPREARLEERMIAIWAVEAYPEELRSHFLEMSVEILSSVEDLKTRSCIVEIMALLPKQVKSQWQNIRLLRDISRNLAESERNPAFLFTELLKKNPSLREQIILSFNEGSLATRYIQFIASRHPRLGLAEDDPLVASAQTALAKAPTSEYGDPR